MIICQVPPSKVQLFKPEAASPKAASGRLRPIRLRPDFQLNHLPQTCYTHIYIYMPQDDYGQYDFGQIAVSREAVLSIGKYYCYYYHYYYY